MKTFIKTILSLVLVFTLTANFVIIYELIGTIQQLNNEIDQIKGDTENNMALYTQELMEKIFLVESDLNLVDENIRKLEKSFGDDLSKSELELIEMLNSSKMNLYNEINVIKDMVQSLSSKDSDIEALISSMENSTNTLNSTLEALTIQVEKNQEDINNLRNSLMELEKQIDDLSEKSNFASINNSDLTLSGKAKRDGNGNVIVGGGSNNKAFLSGDFQSNHFSMYAKFKISESSDFSFIMGKNSSYYGFWAELVNVDNTSYLNIYKDLIGDLSRAPNHSIELDFNLIPGETYALKMTFDIFTEPTSKKQMTIEIFGTNNEYYSYSTYANAYGNPFYYSNSDECTVYNYSLSVQHYYDIKNAKIVVFGHSFVESDSLGAYRSQAFAYLLEKEMGTGKVLNFGLGGDSISAMSNKISNSERFIKNCDYALLCIGTNDRGLSYETYIKRLQECITKIENMGITPVLFTIPHAYYEMTNDMLLINGWIRSSGYYYVDMYDVFANSDGSCKEELFLSDKIHPSVEGHRYIFNRIKMDCPFLF